jgi:Domain of unknown function (DUF4112)
MPTDNPAALKRVQLVTHVLDNAIPIPGTDYRIGLDPIIGLLPGGGDMVGTVASVYIVAECLRFGLPKETLLRMLTNLGIDLFAGSVPVVGDFVDAGWKANSKNLKLLQAHIDNPVPQRAADKRFAWFVAFALIGILAMALLLAFVIAQVVFWMGHLLWG